MSLNWKEIDLVLDELKLKNARIERVLQPSFDSLCLSLYKEGEEGRVSAAGDRKSGGRAIDVLVSVAQGACRIHSLYTPPPKSDRTLRFQQCLKSRIVGGRIEEIRQIGSERVLRIDIIAPPPQVGGSKTKVYKTIGEGAKKSLGQNPELPEELHYILYARLWSGAGNVLLVDDENMVVDVLARRPKRGEVSGVPCTIEAELDRARPSDKIFTVRELPPPESGTDSFNARLEAYYSSHGGSLSRESLLKSARESYAKKSLALENRIFDLEAKAAEFRDAERIRELGDILMANQGLGYEGRYLECEDFYRGGRIRIPIDPLLSVVDNARGYYDRQRKAKSGLEDIEGQLGIARKALQKLEAELAQLQEIEDPFALAQFLAKGGASKSGAKGSALASGSSAKSDRASPGLSLEVSGWSMLIGRNARENDELLRHHVRGSDLWLHARDWAGSYVFIKARKDKSVPLEVLLDAAQLALYYSKGRSNGGGDVYYTQVKYLRRAKDGPLGLVIPTQEKNLSVKIAEDRLRELRTLIGDDD